MVNKWTQEEENFLKENYKDLSYSDMSLKLGRSKGSVAAKCFLLKLNKKISTQVGERYGKLLVLERGPPCKSGVSVSFKCQCDCGNILSIRGNSLRTGNTTSCGCNKSKRKGKEAKARCKPGDHAFHIFENQYKYSAKNRKNGITYDLHTEEFTFLIVQNCFYCDSSPRLWNPYHKKDGKRNRICAGEELTSQQWVYINGIDRVNNSLGYISGNVVPCCTICNIMKRNLGNDEFILHIEKIFRHQHKSDTDFSQKMKQEFMKERQ